MSSGPMNEREFEQMLEAAFANGAISPLSCREKLSRNFGRYSQLYRGGTKKKGSKNPSPPEGKKGKKKTVPKGKVTVVDVANNGDPDLVEPMLHPAFQDLDEKEKSEIMDLETNLVHMIVDFEETSYEVSEKQAKKDEILFAALRKKNVTFSKSVASKMRRKGNTQSDEVIALESLIGYIMFNNMVAAKGDVKKLGTIGFETSEWISDLTDKEKNILRPFVRVPAELKGFFQPPQVRKGIVKKD